MSKLSKTQAGYLARPGLEFVCGECTSIKASKNGHACAYFGPEETVSFNGGSCNYFSPGARGTEALPFLGNFTKQELGYVENATGFGCKRCEYWGIAKRDCKRVEKNSVGDSSGEISKYGCCSQQEPDSWRGKLSNPELDQLIQLSDKGSGRMTADEYRRFMELGGQ